MVLDFTKEADITLAACDPVDSFHKFMQFCDCRIVVEDHEDVNQAALNWAEVK